MDSWNKPTPATIFWAIHLDNEWSILQSTWLLPGLSRRAQIINVQWYIDMDGPSFGDRTRPRVAFFWEARPMPTNLVLWELRWYWASNIFVILSAAPFQSIIWASPAEQEWMSCPRNQIRKEILVGRPDPGLGRFRFRAGTGGSAVQVLVNRTWTGCWTVHERFRFWAVPGRFRSGSSGSGPVFFFFFLIYIDKINKINC